MFASLTPDYFGENNNASNYGLVYSSKLVGSIVGIGVGASVIDAWGYTGAYWIAAVSALVSAGIATFLRQPGRSEVAAHRAKRIQHEEVARTHVGRLREVMGRPRENGQAFPSAAFCRRCVVHLPGALGVPAHQVAGPAAVAVGDRCYQFGVLVPGIFRHAPGQSAGSTTAPGGRPTR